MQQTQAMGLDSQVQGHTEVKAGFPQHRHIVLEGSPSQLTASLWDCSVALPWISSEQSPPRRMPEPFAKETG